MSHGNVWSSPAERRDVDTFVMRATEAFGGAQNVRSIEEVDYKLAFLLSKSGANSGLASTSSEGEIDVIGYASQRETAGGALPDPGLPAAGQPGWESNLTQDPALGNQMRLTPRSMMVMVTAAAVVVQIPALQAPAVEADDDAGPPPIAEPSAAAMDLLAGIQSTFDASILTMRRGQDRCFSIAGHNCVSYGSSRVALYTPDSVAETPRLLYSGQAVAKDRGWRRLGQPFILGADSQASLVLRHPRDAAWPILDDTRLRVEVTLPMIIVRSNGGEPGAYPAAGYCGPLKPGGMVAGGPGTPFG